MTQEARLEQSAAGLEAVRGDLGPQPPAGHQFAQQGAVGAERVGAHVRGREAGVAYDLAREVAEGARKRGLLVETRNLNDELHAAWVG